MSPAEKLLNLVEGVRQTGPGRWVFRSPTRKEKHASVSLRELADGRLLLHDFGGGSAVDILAAVGLDLADLFPEKLSEQHVKRERRPFMATDALRCVAFEALVCAAAANCMVAGKHLPAADRERLLLAAERLQAAVTAVGA